MLALIEREHAREDLIYGDLLSQRYEGNLLLFIRPDAQIELCRPVALGAPTGGLEGVLRLIGRRSAPEADTSPDVAELTVSNFYKPDRSRDDLKDVLIRFLVSLDGYSATAMARNLRDLDAENGTDAADSPLQGLEDGGEPLTEQDRYLCARFVKHLAQTNSQQLTHLTSLVAVGLLTEVVADFVKPTGVVQKSDLTRAASLRSLAGRGRSMMPPTPAHLLICSSHAPSRRRLHVASPTRGSISP
jgi:hypothetical protein